MSLGCFNVINSYPPFDCHAKKGIDNLPLHPFTLLLYSWKHQSEQTITNSIVVQTCFSVDYLDGIKNIVMRRTCGGDGFGVLRAKRSATIIFVLNLKMKDPESIAGKIMVEYNRYFAAAGNL